MSSCFIENIIIRVITADFIGRGGVRGSNLGVVHKVCKSGTVDAARDHRLQADWYLLGLAEVQDPSEPTRLSSLALLGSSGWLGCPSSSPGDYNAAVRGGWSSSWGAAVAVLRHCGFDIGWHLKGASLSLSGVGEK